MVVVGQVMTTTCPQGANRGNDVLMRVSYRVLIVAVSLAALLTVHSAFVYSQSGNGPAGGGGGAGKSNADGIQIGVGTVTLDHPKIFLGERARLTVKFEGALISGDVSFPDVEGLEFIRIGRGSSTVVSSDGQRTETMKHTISVKPQRAGRFEVPYVDLDIKGQRVRLDGFTLVVRERSALTPEEVAELKPDFFIETELSHPVVYITQPTLETTKLFMKKPVVEIARAGEQHPFVKAFDVGDTEKSSRIVGGSTYSVLTLYRLLVPLKSDEMVLPPASLQITYREDFLSQAGRSLFGAFLGGMSNRQSTIAGTQNILGVNALPAGAPGGFSGYVGEAELFAEISSRKVGVGESVEVRLRFQGSGWIDSLNAPQPEFSGEIKVYPERPEVEQLAKKRGLVGHKTFTYVLMPLSEGEFDLGRYSWVYFDVSTQSYKELSVYLGKLNVHGGAMMAGSLPSSTQNTDGGGGEEGPRVAEVLGEDLRDLYRGSTLLTSFNGQLRQEQEEGRWAGSMSAWAGGILALMWVCLAGWYGFLWWRGGASSRGGIGGRAPVGSYKYLSHLRAGAHKAIRERDIEALYQVFSQHALRVLGIDGRAITVLDISRSLDHLGLQPEARGALVDLLSVKEDDRYRESAQARARKSTDHHGAGYDDDKEGQGQDDPGPDGLSWDQLADFSIRWQGPSLEA